MFKNPNWTRDELILALDLYFRIDVSRASQDHPEIVDLSQQLNALPIHEKDSVGENFRNPNGVYMKLCNFLRLDPDYTGKGLDAGSRLDEVIWNDYFDDRVRLKKTAVSIRHNYKTIVKDNGVALLPPIVDDEDFAEGKILERLHKVRERNSSMSWKKKKAILAKTGTLACEVCGFDFVEVYGELGQGFIECHHIVPLSEFKQEKKTRLSDLAVVCANCHRMLHRGRKTVEELRNLTTSRNKVVTRQREMQP